MAPLTVAMAVLALLSFLLVKHPPSLSKNRPSFRDYLQRRSPPYKKTESLLKGPGIPKDSEERNLGPREKVRPPAPSPWAQSLAAHLKESHGEATEVRAKSEGHIALDTGRGIRRYRRVLIRYLMPKTEHSFRALIDPNNGQIIRTWDRTIHERFAGEKGPTLSLEGK